METEVMIEVAIAIVGMVIFALAYWKNRNFRTAVNKFAKKMWREYKDEVFLYADAHLTDVIDDLDVAVSAKIHKHIKNEILRQAIDNKLAQGVDFTDEWVKLKYKEVLEDLIGNQ